MNHDSNSPIHTALLDLVGDVSASLAFSALVTDAAGAAVIHVDGSTTNQLVISITNQTSGDITFAQLKGSASSGNCNLVLKLPNNQLYFYNAPAIDGASTPGTWELATDSASGGAGWVDTIYLANTGTCKLTANGTAGDTLSVVINYSGAVPDDPKALNIPVQLSYLNITNASGTPLKGTTPAQTMGLMANAGRPSPLVGSFVGPQAVLNDGTTQHELTLRMVNTSLDPLQFIVPPSGSPTQSYIEVAVPVSDVAADAVWALCDSAAWGSVTVAMAGSASKGWKASKSATTDGVITLEPDFSTVQNIPPGGTLELQFSGVVSGLEPGVVQVQVQLNRFALIGTQTFGAALEKSPLVYNNGLGTGMTLSAGTLGTNTALSITGDSSNPLTHLTQSGSGPALQVDGGDVNLSNSLSANSATISESVRINGPSSASSNPSLSLGGYGNFNVDADGTKAGRFTVQNGGNVGINNPSPSTTLDVTGDAKVSGSVSANSLSSNSATVSGGLNAGSASVSGSLSANSVSTNGASVNGSLSASSASISNGISANGFITLCDAPDYSKGTVGIGNYAVPNVKLYVNNNQTTGYGVKIVAPSLGGGNHWWALDVHGYCINTTGSWYQLSDVNLKEGIQSFEDGLSTLLQIEPVKYRHIEDANQGDGEHIGLSAQALQKIAPYMVGKTRLTLDSDEEYLCINPGPLTYMLINAVKELNAKIETLEEKIEKLEGK